MARMVHKEIATLAYELAKLAYDNCCMRSNAFFKANPNIILWAKNNQTMFVGLARESLTKLLTLDTTTPEEKDRIMEILLQERSLPKGKVNLAGNSTI